MAWQDKFQQHTTNVAFNLMLSRNMVRALELAKAYSKGESSYIYIKDFGRSVPSMRCLIQRGLVEHHDKPDDFMKWTAQRQQNFERDHRWYTLTPAGELVYQMCILAGLIFERQKEAANA